MAGEYLGPLDDSFSSPISGTMGSGFDDTRNNGARFHRSGDIAAPAGTDFVAPTKLRITHVRDQMSDSPGGMVWATDENGRQHRFIHVVPGVQAGDVVSKGTSLGTLYDMNGPHLHYQVRDKSGEPINWMKNIKRGYAFKKGEDAPFSFGDSESSSMVAGPGAPKVQRQVSEEKNKSINKAMPAGEYLGPLAKSGWDVLSDVLKENKGFAKIFNSENTQVVFADKERRELASKINPGGLEFWPEDETGTPDFKRPGPMGKRILEIYDPELEKNPQELKKAIWGDLIHGMKQDPYFYQLRKQFIANFDTKEIERIKAKKSWWEDANGDTALDHPAVTDAYIRGWLGEDHASAVKGQEKSGNTMYSSAQLKILKQMEAYIKTGQGPSEYLGPDNKAMPKPIKPEGFRETGEWSSVTGESGVIEKQPGEYLGPLDEKPTTGIQDSVKRNLVAPENQEFDTHAEPSQRAGEAIKTGIEKTQEAIFYPLHKALELTHKYLIEPVRQRDVSSVRGPRTFQELHDLQIGEQDFTTPNRIPAPGEAAPEAFAPLAGAETFVPVMETYLAPTYLKLIGRAGQLLGQVGKDAFYKYAPDWMFKQGEGGLPEVLSSDRISEILGGMNGEQRAEMARKYPAFKDVLNEWQMGGKVPETAVPAEAGTAAGAGAIDRAAVAGELVEPQKKLPAGQGFEVRDVPPETILRKGEKPYYYPPDTGAGVGEALRQPPAPRTIEATPEPSREAVKPPPVEVKEGSDYRPIDSLKPTQEGSDLYSDTAKGYARGELGGTKGNVEKLTRPDQLPPITIDKDGNIIDGNQRWAAAKIAGLDKVRVKEAKAEPKAKAKVEEKAVTGKEPWEMTWNEYNQEIIKNHPQRNASSAMAQRYQIKYAHQESIRDALSEGKPVPSEVLAEYPDLAKKAEGKEPELEFIRKLKKSETANPGSTNNLAKIPQREGYQVIYKPYGETGEREGRGYYYKKGTETKMYSGGPDTEAYVKKVFNNARQSAKLAAKDMAEIKNSVKEELGITGNERAKMLIEEMQGLRRSSEQMNRAALQEWEKRINEMPLEDQYKEAAKFQRGEPVRGDLQPYFETMRGLTDQKINDVNAQGGRQLNYVNNYLRGGQFTNYGDPVISGNQEAFFNGEPFGNYLDLDANGKPKLYTREVMPNGTIIYRDLGRSGMVGPEAAGEQTRAGRGGRTLTGGRGYFKQKVFRDWQEALMVGYQPRYSLYDLVLSDLNQKDHYIYGMKTWNTARAEGLVKFYPPGQQSEGWDKINDPLGRVVTAVQGREIEEGPMPWDQTPDNLNVTTRPDREPPRVIIQEAYAPKEVARVFNNFLGAGLKGKPWYDRFRNVTDFVRRTNVSLSTFHGKVTLNNDIATGIGEHGAQAIGAMFTGDVATAKKEAAALAKALGGVKTVKNMGEAARITKAYYDKVFTNPIEQEGVAEYIKAGGTMPDPETLKGLSQSLADGFVAAARDMKDAHILKSVNAAVHTTSTPIMTYMVPYSKLMNFFERRALSLKDFDERGIDISGIEWDREMRANRQFIDAMYGQLAMENLHFPRFIRDLSFGLVKYPGWNIGSGTWIYGNIKGINEYLQAHGPKINYGAGPPPEMSKLGKQSLRYSFGLLAKTGIFMGLLYYGIHRKFPDDPMELFEKGVWTGGYNRDGSKEYVRDADYMRDMVGIIKEPVSTIKNKSADYTRLPWEIITNEDYFGNKTYTPGHPEKWPLEFGKKVGQQITPYSVQQMVNARSNLARYGQFAGLTMTPPRMSRTPMEAKISEEFAKHPVRGQTPAEQERYQKKLELFDIGQRGSKEDFDSRGQEGVKQGWLTVKQLGEMNKKISNLKAYRFGQVKDIGQAIEIYKSGSDEEKAAVKSILGKKIDNAEKAKKDLSPYIDDIHEIFGTGPKKTKPKTDRYGFPIPASSQ
jgi:hypothetical protein